MKKIELPKVYLDVLQAAHDIKYRGAKEAWEEMRDMSQFDVGVGKYSEARRQNNEACAPMASLLSFAIDAAFEDMRKRAGYGLYWYKEYKKGDWRIRQVVDTIKLEALDALRCRESDQHGPTESIDILKGNLECLPKAWPVCFGRDDKPSQRALFAYAINSYVDQRKDECTRGNWTEGLDERRDKNHKIVYQGNPDIFRDLEPIQSERALHNEARFNRAA